MPVQDIPSRVRLNPETIIAVDLMAENLVRLLRDAVEGCELDGNPVVVLGVECIAAQMNYLVDEMAKRRTYTIQLSPELKQADLMSLLMSEILDRALTRRG